MEGWGWDGDGVRGVQERLGEREGSEELRDCVSLGVRVCGCGGGGGGEWGEGRDRVRYVMHYKIRSCVAVIALIIRTVPADGT